MSEPTTTRAKLEAVARLAGYCVKDGNGHGLIVCEDGRQNLWWSPPDSDSDAFRLAIRLRIDLHYYSGGQSVLATNERATFARQLVSNSNVSAACVREAIWQAALQMTKITKATS
jgi:hypothetical protein